MKKHDILGVFLALVLFQSCTKTEYFEIGEQNNLNLSAPQNIQTEFENELFDLVNEHRLSIGLNELQFEITSYQQASEHNDYMISKGQISHTNFNTRAENISAKTGATDVTENVAKEYNSPEEAFTAWLGSPKHRINMEGDFTHSALNVKANSKGDLYFTQIFIR